jgi:hypothetical protein
LIQFIKHSEKNYHSQLSLIEYEKIKKTDENVFPRRRLLLVQYYVKPTLRAVINKIDTLTVAIDLSGGKKYNGISFYSLIFAFIIVIWVYLCLRNLLYFPYHNALDDSLFT